MAENALEALLTKIVETQQTTAEALKKIDERLAKIEDLKIDPAKLVGSTKGVKPQLREVKPTDSTKPNLQEPIPLGANGAPVPRPCWKCNQMYTGPKHC